MLKTRGDRLREARKKHFSSARLAAAALGIPVSTFTAHERAEQPGGRDYGPEDAKRYARRFHVTPEWLLTGKADSPRDLAFEAEAPDETPRKRMVPIVGYVGAGARAHTYAVDSGQFDEIEAPENATEKTVGLEIRGESLGMFFDRWVVTYDDVRTPVSSSQVGRLCIVGLADERVLVKKIKRGKDGLYTLLSATEPPIEDVAIMWAARVMAMVPKD
jgi:hypothetical protein